MFRESNYAPPPPQPELPEPPYIIVDTENENGFATGETPGFFDVTPDGAAIYRIPLWVPPGRNGLQPDLALQYDSRGGYGIMGVGWRFDGLSKIKRCQKTFSNDGYVQAIRFDELDAFCLDGQRLVQVSHNAAVDGAEYRTRPDTFVKIVIRGDDALGPLAFDVYEKGGRILTYEADPATEFRAEVSPLGPDDGGIADVQLTIVRFSWSLRRMIDRSGNALWIDYMFWAGGTANVSQPSGQESEFLPYLVRYTGFVEQGVESTTEVSNPYFQPLRSVQLFYGSHPEAEVTYISGLRVKHSARLERIEMWGPNPIGDASNNIQGVVPAPSALLRLYEITYRSDSITGRSLISTICECDGWPTTPAIPGQPVPTPPPGAKLGVRKRPHVFSWQLGKLGYRDYPTGIVDVRTKIPRFDTGSRFLVLDLDADGKDDIVYTTASMPYNFAFRLSDSLGLGFGPVTLTNIGVWGGGPIEAMGRFALPRPIDFYMDGHMGFIVPALTIVQGERLLDNQLFVSVQGANGSGTMILPGYPIPFELVEVADIDGDRLPDLLVSPFGDTGPFTDDYYRHIIDDSRHWYLWRGKGTASPLPQVFPPPHLVLDVDGDGAMEILWRYDTPGIIYKWGTRYLGLSVHLFGKSPFVTNLFGDRDYLFVDLNGDRLLDAVAFNPQSDSPHTFTVATNTGNGFLPAIDQILGIQYKDVARRTLSFRADGKQDVILHWTSDAQYPRAAAQVSILHWQNEQFSVTNLPINSTAASAEELELFEVGDFNGDGLDDFIMMNNGELHLYIHDGSMPDLLTGITNTLGSTTQIRYLPLTNNDVYKRTKECKYPLYASIRARWQVAEVSRDDGVGGFNSYLYTYEDGRSDLRGEGFLGFLARQVTHAQTGVTTRTTYDSERKYDVPFPLSLSGHGTIYPYAGLPVKSVTRTPLPNGVEHFHQVNTTYEAHQNDTGGVMFPYANAIDDQEYEKQDGTTNYIGRVQTLQYFDDYGNLTSRIVDWVEGGLDQGLKVTSRETYTIKYANDPDNWLVDQKSLVEIKGETPAGDSVIRRTGYEYDRLGRVTRVIIEPGDPKAPSGYHPLGPQPDGVQTQFISYDRMPVGMIERVSVEESTSRSGAKRIWEYTFDSREHMFPMSVVNKLGHRIRASYHPGLGVPSVIEDENGLQTNFVYDGFGRKRAESAPGGYDRTISYFSSLEVHPPPFNPPVSKTDRIAITDNNNAEFVTSFDSLGRPFVTRMLARDDKRAVVRRIKYDGLGRVIQSTAPYFDTDPAIFSNYAYDWLGRIRTAKRADGIVASYSYVGRELTVFDGNGFRHDYLCDVQGRITQSADSDGHVVMRYAYAPFDLLTRVVDAALNVTERRFDRLGRMIAEIDPNSGQRTLTYNVFGEVIQEVRGEQTVEFDYDDIGRVNQIHRPEGQTTFAWDSAPNGISEISSITTPTGVHTSFLYDAAGRLNTKRWSLYGRSYGIGFTYDSVGRLSKLIYPIVDLPIPITHVVKPPFEIEYLYGNYGALQAIVHAQTRYPFWTKLDSDASGQFGSEQFGNGLISRRIEDPVKHGRLMEIVCSDVSGLNLLDEVYAFDDNLNLTLRTDNLMRTSESFVYDDLDRLTGWVRENSYLEINHWKQAVTWKYDDIGNIARRQVDAGPGMSLVYSYGVGAGPHAVTSTNLGTYGYDYRGNQVSAPGRQVEYTSFNLPSKITIGGNDRTFDYDGEGQRTVQFSQTGLETVFMGGLYEQKPGQYEKFLVPSPNRIIAEVIRPDAVEVDDSVLFLHEDHLGSIELVTDGQGKVIERHKYDPFGAPINPSDLSPVAMPNGQDTQEDIGFTGHKQEVELGLIDMRARWYDPAIARFLSPDPLGPSLRFGQALNRYSYVLNNPLTWRDPSGLQPEEPPNNDLPPYSKEVFPDGSTREYVPSMGEYGGEILTRAPDPQASGPGRSADIGPERGNFTSAGTVSNPDGRGGAGIRDVDKSAALFLRLDREHARGFQQAVPFANPSRNAFYNGLNSMLAAAVGGLHLGPILLGAAEALGTLEVTASSASGVAIQPTTQYLMTLLGGTTAGLSTPGFTMSLARLWHVLGHAQGLAKASNSYFFMGTNWSTLMQQAAQVAPVLQGIAGPLRFIRIVDMGPGLMVGIDRATGLPTSVFTVVTEGLWDIVTAFAGTPGR